MKKSLLYVIGFILFFGAMIWWSKSLQSNDPNVVSRTGLHWHPTLTIYVKGEKQEVSPNIGIGLGRMGSIHTHEPDGTLHVESQGLVRKDDIKLKKFFETWGKDINSFGTNVKMTVNGEENTELENYVMQDKDKIQLYYTTTAQSEASKPKYQTMSVKELKDSLVSKDFALINVHIPYTAEIEGTDAFVPYNEIALNLGQLPTDKNKKIVLYCESGNMSAQAAQTLTDLGYTNVVDIPGGMIEWEKQGYKLVRN